MPFAGIGDDRAALAELQRNDLCAACQREVNQRVLVLDAGQRDDVVVGGQADVAKAPSCR